MTLKCNFRPQSLYIVEVRKMYLNLSLFKLIFESIAFPFRFFNFSLDLCKLLLSTLNLLSSFYYLLSKGSYLWKVIIMLRLKQLLFFLQVLQFLLAHSYSFRPKLCALLLWFRLYFHEFYYLIEDWQHFQDSFTRSFPSTDLPVTLYLILNPKNNS